MKLTGRAQTRPVAFAPFWAIGYNADMMNPHFARIEAQLERLIEGAFAQILRQRVNAQDLLLHVSRAFEENIDQADADDPRPIAPDRFTIHLHPEVQEQLTQQQPHLTALLGEHLTELNTNLGFRLLHVPVIEFVSDPALGYREVLVEAQHRTRGKLATASLKRVDIEPSDRTLQNPCLIIDGQEPVILATDVVNIGRSRDNNVVLQDPYVSRHHAQLRLRFGSYMLFDNDSQGGTFVNDVRIREHKLQPGDVILIGKTRLLYLEDTDQGWQSQTDIYPLG